MRCSAASSRSSSSRLISARAKSSYVKSARAGPRHIASASSSTTEAAAGSSSHQAASLGDGGLETPGVERIGLDLQDVSVVAGEQHAALAPLRRAPVPAPNAAARRATHSAFSLPAESSPQSSSRIRSVETTRLALRSRSASRDRCLCGPRSTGAPSDRAWSGPRILNSMGGPHCTRQDLHAT